MLAVIALQMGMMAFDEFHFHLKRGLPRWERIGHPIDTFSTLIPLSIAAFSSASDSTIFWFIVSGAVSCALITKDEFIHARLCSPAEHWFHAALFVIHPIVLMLVGYNWTLNSPVNSSDGLSIMLKCVAALVFSFMAYQTIYWNFIWQDSVNQRA